MKVLIYHVQNMQSFVQVLVILVNLFNGVDVY